VSLDVVLGRLGEFATEHGNARDEIVTFKDGFELISEISL
jgi:hypothetical protein